MVRRSERTHVPLADIARLVKEAAN